VQCGQRCAYRQNNDAAVVSVHVSHHYIPA
jgi:hypothetical protein